MPSADTRLRACDVCGRPTRHEVEYVRKDGTTGHRDCLAFNPRTYEEPASLA